MQTQQPVVSFVTDLNFVFTTNLKVSAEIVVEVGFVLTGNNGTLVSTVALGSVHHVACLSHRVNFAHSATRNLTRENDMTKIGLR